jgi:hypothetical protein
MSYMGVVCVGMCKVGYGHMCIVQLGVEGYGRKRQVKMIPCLRLIYVHAKEVRQVWGRLASEVREVRGAAPSTGAVCRTRG